MTTLKTTPLSPLKGTRIVSLALNLPSPAALMRCQQMAVNRTDCGIYTVSALD